MCTERLYVVYIRCKIFKKMSFRKYYLLQIQMDAWQMIPFLGISWRRTSHGKIFADRVSLFVLSEKEKHQLFSLCWGSMTNTQTLAAHLRSGSGSVPGENANIQYSLMCLSGTLSLSVRVLTLQSSVLNRVCVPACSQPVLLHGRTSTHALSWQRGPQAE